MTPNSPQQQCNIKFLVAASSERVFEEAVVLVVAPDELLVAQSGRVACLLLEVLLPVSYDAFPVLYGCFVQSRLKTVESRRHESGRQKCLKCL